MHIAFTSLEGRAKMKVITRDHQLESRNLLASLLKAMPNEAGFKLFDCARQHMLGNRMTGVEAVTYIISKLSVEIRRDKVGIHDLLEGDASEELCRDFLNSELRC